jgi:WD40 repeat protein
LKGVSFTRFSPDGKMVAFASRRTIRLWGLKSGAFSESSVAILKTFIE